MPDLTISLTNNQAQRLAAALGASSNAEATQAVKALLKERVKAYEVSQSSQTAGLNAQTQVDTDFAGF